MNEASDRRTLLARTICGSHLWHMNHPGSDTDYFTIYQIPTTDILSGILKGDGAHFHPDPLTKTDEASFEIGHVVSQLVRSNPNFVWGVLSPIVNIGGDELRRLREIVLRTPALTLVPPCLGMAHNQMRDVQHGITTDPYQIQKKRCAAIRVLRFAIHWCETGEPLFAPVSEAEATMETYNVLLERLDFAYRTSSLPKKVDDTLYREFLLDLRLKNLEDVAAVSASPRNSRGRRP